MANIDKAAREFREMDDLALQKSPIHSLHPLAKLIVTIAYIFTVVSFDKYNLSGLMIMLLYPVLLFSISGIAIRTCFYKLRVVMPLICAVGVLNPFFDRELMFSIGALSISGGIISMITLMLKGIFSLMASFVFVATTSIDSVCYALRRIHIPGVLVTLVLLTYRYISVMLDEVSHMNTAYKLRAPGQKGIHYTAWGSFLGQLLLRSMDRAEELYSSMQLRGFKGDFFYADQKKATIADYLFTIAALCMFALFRYIDVARLLGSLFV